MVDLTLLGGLELTGPDGRSLLSRLSQPKRIALFAFVATGRDGARTRDAAAAIFWPDLDDRHARAALRRALHYIRLSLPDGVLLSGPAGEIRTDPDRVRCDVTAFDRAIREGRLADALDLYRGEMLEGFFLAESIEFQHWVDAERRRLRDAAAAAARALALEAEEGSDAASAIKWATRELGLAPYSDEAAQRCIRMYDALGETSAALRLYEDFASRLRDEYGLDPAEATNAAALRASRSRVATTAFPVSETIAAAAAADAETGRVSHPPRHRGLLTAALIVLVAILGGIGVLRGLGASPSVVLDAPSDLPRVIVYTLTAESNDPEALAFGRIASDWLVDRIAASGIAAVMQRDSARPESADLPADARDRGAAILIEGSTARIGDSLMTRARAFDAATGRALGHVNASAPIDHALDALDELSSRVVGLLASRLHVELSAFMTDPAPPRYEAYRAYTDGIAVFQRYTRNREARELLRRAFVLDTTFLAPLLLEGRASVNGPEQDFERADSVLRFLQARRSRLSAVQRAELDAFDARLRGDRAAVYRAYRDASRLLPDKLYEYGVAAVNIGRPREAVEVLERVPDPEQARNYWKMLTASLHYLGEHARERELALQNIDRNPRDGRSLNPLIYALSATGRIDDLRDAFATADALPRDDVVHWSISLRHIAAIDLANHGHAEAGREFAREAVDLLRNEVGSGNAELEEYWDLLHLAGMYGELLDMARSRAPGFSGDPFWLTWGGLAAARLERHEEARRYLDALRSATGSTDDYDRILDIAMLQAATGEREAALESIRQAIRMGNPWTTLHMEQHRFESLRDDPEFQKIIAATG